MRVDYRSRIGACDPLRERSRQTATKFGLGAFLHDAGAGGSNLRSMSRAAPAPLPRYQFQAKVHRPTTLHTYHLSDTKWI
jgi:hypothetical protein